MVGLSKVSKSKTLFKWSALELLKTLLTRRVKGKFIKGPQAYVWNGSWKVPRTCTLEDCDETERWREAKRIREIRERWLVGWWLG